VFGTEPTIVPPEHATHLPQEPIGEADVLENFSGDDDVEALVFEREALIDVSPDGVDSEPFRLGERRPVDVEADDLVAVGIRPGECAGPAPDVEHPPAGPAHDAAKELAPLRLTEDEVRGAPVRVVMRVQAFDALEFDRFGDSTTVPIQTPDALSSRPPGRRP
jgi:hypothetical protein